MALKYVFSEAALGLRRNVSMSVALIVTIFVSLSLVGAGLLLNAQADKAQDSWGGKLQITVALCNQNSQGPNCDKQNVTPQQKAAITQVLRTNPEVASFYHQTKAQAFAKYKRLFIAKDATDQKIYGTVTVNDMQETYWVKLKNPQQYAGIESQLTGMQGVDNVRDLRAVLKPIYFWISIMKWGAIGIAAFLLVAAILQVANTIRLATLARRREIAIMRLVGASTLFISLPFLLETLVAALIGIALAAAGLSLFTWLVVYDELRGKSHLSEWLSWNDTAVTIGLIAILGVVLTLVPTLVTTRKYLRV
jgi:cell division transport system permease protein